MIDAVQTLMEQLTDTGFFELGGVLSDEEITRLTSLILAYSKDMSAGAPQSQADLIAAMTGSGNKNKKSTVSILTHDLYMVVNAVMAQHGLEGKTLLRVSRLSTGLYAFFMGFVAMFLQVIGFGIGWVYMSMGVLIGSAVGPASLTLLMERANGFWVGAGAVGGFIIGVMSWFICAVVNSGEISYESIGSDWPWVVGNVCSIGSGFLIAFGGSMIQPNKQFKWEMLNDQIPLVDDVEPLRGNDESEEALNLWNWVAISTSTTLTFILIVMWPIPMYFSGVFSSMGFTLWSITSILWILIAAFVILAVPLWEIYSAYVTAKAIADALANADQKDILNNDKIAKGSSALAAEAAAKEAAKEAEELRSAAAAVATSKGGGPSKSGSTTPKGTPKKAGTPSTPKDNRVGSNGKPV
jgi:MFS family permease